tara:strand:- start:817 stop:1170 length:354 start_codon:yes stop_codon:yes gene_type:complete
MDKRARMRASNRKAVLHLLELGYDEIWLKPHNRRADLVYTRGEWYRAIDLWNLFDGICISPQGEAIYIQIKTNAWAKDIDIINFMSDKKMLAMSINVKYVGKKWEVLLRGFDSNNYV